MYTGLGLGLRTSTRGGGGVDLQFAVTYATTQFTFKFKLPSDESISIDWGDGTSNDYNGNNATIVTATSGYSSEDTYTAKITGDVKGITYIDVIGQNHIAGDLTNCRYMLNLTDIRTYNSANITGDISNFTNLTKLSYINLTNSTKWTGNLSGLINSPIDYFNIQAASGIYGDIGIVLGKETLNDFYLSRQENISCSVFTPPSGIGNFNLIRLLDIDIDTLSLDNYLTSISSAVTSAVTGTTDFTNTDERRSTNSDAAVANLTTNGYTLTGLLDPYTLAYIDRSTKEILTLETYEGSGTAVHPSVIELTAAKNGYKIYQVNTPYPDNNADYENPSIWGANVYNDFVVPNGVTNPIYPQQAGGYNADTEIIEHDGKLYVMFKEMSTALNSYSNNEAISLLESSDGITWTYKGVVLSADDVGSTDTRIASPSVVFDGSIFHVFYLDMNETAWRIRHRTGNSILGPYTNEEDCTGLTPITGGGWWHLGVIYENSKFYMTMNATETEQYTGGGPSIYSAVSNDGAIFTRSDFATVYRTETWEHNYYRPKIAKIDEVYKLYFSFKSKVDQEFYTAVCDIYLIE